MMQLKAGVNLNNLQTPALLGVLIASDLFRLTFSSLDFVITSVNDGKHMQGSKHYEGKAFDIRTHQIVVDGSLVSSAERMKVITDFHLKLKTNLGTQFDTLLEDFGTDNEHIHVEFDPK